jgi:hypothetical protein
VTLSIESEPPGARVSEGGTVYGVTPLKLNLSFATGAAKPRVLVLELAGHRPYVLEQGPTASTALVHAVLVPEPSLPPAPSTVPSSLPVSVPHSARRPASARSPEPAASNDPAWDIRLSR